LSRVTFVMSEALDRALGLVYVSSLQHYHHHHLLLLLLAGTSMTDSTDETSIPTENARNRPRMNGVMRHKVGTKTFPWTKAALNHTPPPQDEDIPAAKKLRLQTSFPTSVDDVVDTPTYETMNSTRSPVDTPTSETMNSNGSPDNTAASLPHAGASRAPRRSWTAEENAKLVDAVKKHGKDWDVVAALVPGKTRVQCRIRWVNYADPSIVRAMGKWTTEEDAKLIDAVKKCGKDWGAVAALVPGRTNEQCGHRWGAVRLATTIEGKNTSTGKWTAEEEAKLIDAVAKCGKDWAAVAALVPGRANEQCRRAWTLRLDPNIDRTPGRPGRWKAEEDAKLIDAVAKCGNDWVAVAALVPGRTREQCRTTWTLRFVVPTIEGTSTRTGKWTAEEDAKLIDAVTKCGKDWVAVAALVPGRTNAQCRTIWRLRFVAPTIKGVPTRTGKWTAEEEAKLIDAVTKCGKNWAAIAALVPGRTNTQCRMIWTDRLAATIEGTPTRTGKWTTEEDAKLIDAVKKCGKHWVAVAALVPGRTNKQCHTRLKDCLRHMVRRCKAD
jgi:hypothetical protein